MPAHPRRAGFADCYPQLVHHCCARPWGGFQGEVLAHHGSPSAHHRHVLMLERGLLAPGLPQPARHMLLALNGIAVVLHSSLVLPKARRLAWHQLAVYLWDHVWRNLHRYNTGTGPQMLITAVMTMICSSYNPDVRQWPSSRCQVISKSLQMLHRSSSLAPQIHAVLDVPSTKIRL